MSLLIDKTESVDIEKILEIVKNFQNEGNGENKNLSYRFFGEYFLIKLKQIGDNQLWNGAVFDDLEEEKIALEIFLDFLCFLVDEENSQIEQLERKYYDSLKEVVSGYLATLDLFPLDTKKALYFSKEILKKHKEIFCKFSIPEQVVEQRIQQYYNPNRFRQVDKSMFMVKDTKDFFYFLLKNRLQVEVDKNRKDYLKSEICYSIRKLLRLNDFQGKIEGEKFSRKTKEMGELKMLYFNLGTNLERLVKERVENFESNFF